MDYKAMAVAIKLCGSTPKVDQCKKECQYWDDGDMSKCIPRMTEDAATAITDLLARAEESEAENAVLRGGCGRAGKKCEHWEWKGDKHGEFETTDR